MKEVKRKRRNFPSTTTEGREYPQYSRPEEWMGKKVPSVLLSGHHAKIENWRREQSLRRTYERRPDLLKSANLTEKDRKFLDNLRNNTCK